jgi:hypothetical protein
VTPAIEWTGNGGNPFQRSDLNFDGAIDGGDYDIFLANNLTDIDPDMMLDDVGSYVFGDLDGDQDNDVQDFRLFKADYIAANGAAAFAALAGVPEPASVCLLVLGAGIALQLHRRSRS